MGTLKTAKTLPVYALWQVIYMPYRRRTVVPAVQRERRLRLRRGQDLSERAKASGCL
jgi:hypothetical protein